MKINQPQRPECFENLIGHEIAAQLHVLRLLAKAADDRNYVAALARTEGTTQFRIKHGLTDGLPLNRIHVATAQEKVIVTINATSMDRAYLYIPFAACVDESAFAEWLRSECRRLDDCATLQLLADELRARAHARAMQRLPKALAVLIRRKATARERLAANAKKGGAS